MQYMILSLCLFCSAASTIHTMSRVKTAAITQVWSETKPIDLCSFNKDKHRARRDNNAYFKSRKHFKSIANFLLASPKRNSPSQEALKKQK